LHIIIHPPWRETLAFKIIVAIAAIFLLILFYRIRFSFLEKQKKHLEKSVLERTNELSEMNSVLEERQEEIFVQNIEIEKHRNHLEKIVEERTDELVKAKIKAEESDRLKSSFLANLSHEIRTPMNAIYGFSGLLNNDNLTKEKRSGFLKIINSSCESLLVLINDIIDISIIEAHHLDLNNEVFLVDEVLLNLESFFHLKNAKNIEITFVNKEEKNKFEIFTDRVRFNQIFTNLLNNAYKYTDNGYIRFGYEIHDNYALFYVSDTGIGIEDSEHDKIFGHFYKIENDPNKVYRGTGIGLAICMKMVNLLGGKIWVNSKVDKGSTFYFNLPLDPKVEIDFPIPEKNNITSSFLLKDCIILIAEDELFNYQLLQNLLEPLNAELIWAYNGKKAVEYIAERPGIKNCIVLMDIKMPDLDGYEATKQIKAINNTIPIIAVTAYAQKSEKERILNSQFDDYISKPIDMEVLFEVLSKYTNNGK